MSDPPLTHQNENRRAAQHSQGSFWTLREGTRALRRELRDNSAVPAGDGLLSTSRR
jgi:hypothetical protein